MPLSLSELTHIAETFAREHNPALTVVGVASTDPGRVELLVTVRGCHNDPCALLLNLSRDDRNMFEAELGAQLREALRARRTRRPLTVRRPFLSAANAVITVLLH